MLRRGSRLPAGPLHVLALGLLAVGVAAAVALVAASSVDAVALGPVGICALGAVVALIGWWRYRRAEAIDALQSAEDRRRLQEALKEREMARRNELHNFYMATVQMLADALAAKDPAAATRADEVAGYVASVAARLDITPGRQEDLVAASLLHDLGKLAISEEILRKPGPLSQSEREAVEEHPRIGYELMEQVPELDSLAPAVLHHHERYDGSGYPSGLKGDEIPLEARVIGVADGFSAMTSERPYRAPLTVEEACVELERCAGAQFDPRVVKLFCTEVRRGHDSGEPSDDVATRARMALELGRVAERAESNSA